MAQLQLQVGQVTATVTATDAQAARILQGMLKARGYDIDTMTVQQQADAVIAETIKFYNESALANEINEAITVARDAVIAAPPEFG